MILDTNYNFSYTSCYIAILCKNCSRGSVYYVEQLLIAYTVYLDIKKEPLMSQFGVQRVHPLLCLKAKIFTLGERYSCRGFVVVVVANSGVSTLGLSYGIFMEITHRYTLVINIISCIYVLAKGSFVNMH